MRSSNEAAAPCVELPDLSSLRRGDAPDVRIRVAPERKTAFRDIFMGILQ
jgi:hypothetical protein